MRNSEWGTRDGLIEEERDLNKELQELRLAEKSFFKHKSRIQWLQEGDQNTKFFHGVMAAKQKENTIRTLTDSRGI